MDNRQIFCPYCEVNGKKNEMKYTDEFIYCPKCGAIIYFNLIKKVYEQLFYKGFIGFIKKIWYRLRG